LQSVANHGGTRGAECQFLLCQMEFNNGAFEQTEQAIFEFIEAYANYDRWKHEAFLLLVDTYIAMEDWFQARATAESILEFVQVEEIRSKATAKLTTIDRLELEALNPAPSDSTNVESPITE